MQSAHRISRHWSLSLMNTWFPFCTTRFLPYLKIYSDAAELISAYRRPPWTHAARCICCSWLQFICENISQSATANGSNISGVSLHDTNMMKWAPRTPNDTSEKEQTHNWETVRHKQIPAWTWVLSPKMFSYITVVCVDNIIYLLCSLRPSVFYF